MYLPQHFEEKRSAELHRVITEFPLGALVVNGADGLDANHLPFLLDHQAGGRGQLLGHVARANPLWKEVRDGDEVLVLFSPANAYISPSWYPSKQEFHRQVPTWNYQAVHVHGRIFVCDDASFVRGVVERLTRDHEARVAPDSPWNLSDAPPEYIEQMLCAVVGLRIDITRMIGKWKLSQNKEERDRRGAAGELFRRGERVISQAMRESLEDQG